METIVCVQHSEEVYYTFPKKIGYNDDKKKTTRNEEQSRCKKQIRTVFIFYKFFTSSLEYAECYIKSIVIRKNVHFTVGEETVIEAFRELATAASEMENN